MKLVVQRARALHHGDELRDPRKARSVVRVVEALGETGRELSHLGAEHGDEAAFEQRLEDLLEMALARRSRAGHLQRGFLSQHRAVQLLELAARLDPQLVDEQLATRLIGVERLRLPPGAIEGEHVVASEPLAHRVLLLETLELADELAVAFGREMRLDTLLERRQPKLLEVRDVRLGARPA